MSVMAGTIITVGGNHVIDRLQSAGLGNVTMPIDVVREIGNEFIVDKVPMEPDFTFQMMSYDVSIDMMAWLTGESGANGHASGSRPGAGDAPGTEYIWNNCRFVNITSPWKDHFSASAGKITAGHIVPGYYPTKLSYSFGTTADASQTLDLGGGEFYYAGSAPIEEYATGDGATVAYTTSLPAITRRVGGGTSTIYETVWGVIVGGDLMIQGEDYTVTNGSSPAAGISTITFKVAPVAAATISYCYFTTTAQAWPDTVHSATLVKPGAVRGRNVLPWIYIGGQRHYLYGVQTATLDATVATSVTRELGSDKIIGRAILGFDVKGLITVQSKDQAAFISFLADATGVTASEVFGFFYQNPVPMGIDIQDPKNPQNIIKTLFVPDAQIQPPGTPARVNAPTDFGFAYESLSGTFSEFKGGHQAF